MGRCRGDPAEPPAGSEPAGGFSSLGLGGVTLGSRGLHARPSGVCLWSRRSLQCVELCLGCDECRVCGFHLVARCFLVGAQCRADVLLCAVGQRDVVALPRNQQQPHAHHQPLFHDPPPTPFTNSPTCPLADLQIRRLADLQVCSLICQHFPYRQPRCIPRWHETRQATQGSHHDEPEPDATR